MEDSPNKEVTENDALLEELLLEAETVEEPGASVKEKTIAANVDSEDAPVPMVVTSVESAGHAIIYDIKTGAASIANRNMLASLLKIKDDNGERIFTTRKPPYEPARGTFKCLLHPDLPNRVHYDEIGLPTCKKSNIINQYQVNQHMKKRHPASWEALDLERKEVEKQEERNFQRSLLMGRQEPQPKSKRVYKVKKSKQT